jgi:hypothetical protein
VVVALVKISGWSYIIAQCIYAEQTDREQTDFELDFRKVVILDMDKDKGIPPFTQ